MKRFKSNIIYLMLISFILTCLPIALFAQAKWYKSYEMGIETMKAGSWKRAAKHFENALKVKKKDKHKTRAYGTVFIEYYPHRELGICLYNLGDGHKAKRELTISVKQAPTRRARQFLSKINAGNIPEPEPEITPPPVKTDGLESGSTTEPPRPETAYDQVGERLRIAILPFENKGASGDFDLLDKLITVCVKMERFKVLERTQLERVMQEQKLGMSGFIDATTAAEIGKGMGVDAVVTGSVTWTRNDISIDARFIDTETAAIISAQDAYAQDRNLQSVNSMLEALATKFTDDFPIVKGYVIKIDGDQLTLDIGRAKGVKKGMKCYAYREGAPIVHPVTKKVIGKMIDVLCEIQLTSVYDQFATAKIVKQREGLPGVGDMVITK